MRFPLPADDGDFNERVDNDYDEARNGCPLPSRPLVLVVVYHL